VKGTFSLSPTFGTPTKNVFSSLEGVQLLSLSKLSWGISRKKVGIVWLCVSSRVCVRCVNSCMWVQLYVYMCVYLCVCLTVCVCQCVCVFMSLCLCVSVWLCLYCKCLSVSWEFVCLSVWVSVWLVCLYDCVSVCI